MRAGRRIVVRAEGVEVGDRQLRDAAVQTDVGRQVLLDVPRRLQILRQERLRDHAAARVADDVERRSEEDLVQIDAVENCSVGAGARPGHEHFARIDEVLTSEFLDDLRVVPAVMRHTASRTTISTLPLT